VTDQQTQVRLPAWLARLIARLVEYAVRVYGWGEGCALCAFRWAEGYALRAYHWGVMRTAPWRAGVMGQVKSRYHWVIGLPGRAQAAWVGMSLVRTATHAKFQLATASPWHRRRRDAKEWVLNHLRAESSWWWLFVVMFGAVWLPIPWGLSLFEKPQQVGNFLQALWQVEGAMLAISITVVVFVFQAVYASRLRGSLRQFAEETFLFPIFFSGVYAIGLVGLVLLGGGYGAPGGWAATWTAAMGAGLGGALIFLFISTIRAIEPSALHKRRLARARREIERETERIILQRIATNLLNRFCEDNGIEFSPGYAITPSQTAVGVPAQFAGEVRDIKLRTLRKLGEAAQELKLPKPRLRAYLDERVNENLELFWAEPGVLANIPEHKSIVRLRKRDGERAFKATIKQLHNEATTLIANPVPGEYEDILDVYEDMVVALPTTWAQYGQQYGPNVAGNITMFEFDFLDEVEQDLYEEIRSALRGSNREIAHDSLHFPLRIAYRAVDLRASALSGRMLRLLVAGVDALIRSPMDAQTKKELLSSVVTSLESYGSYYLAPMVRDDDSDVEKREFGRVAMLQVYEAIAEVCKRFLDFDPSELELIGMFNGLYEKFFTHWEPQHEGPWRFELEHAEQAGIEQAMLENLRARVELREAQVALHDELDDARLMQRLGLMFWVLRRLRETGRPEWAAAWPVFANYFGDVARLARVTDKAIEYDFRDRGRWSSWILDTLPSGEAHFIGVDGELIDAFIVRALELVPPDGPVPTIEPMDSTRGRLDDPTARIQAVINQANIAALLPDDRLADRAGVLAAALVASNQTRKDREDQKTIDAPLSDAKIDAFKTTLFAAFERERWLHDALVASGAVVASDADPPEGAGGSEVYRWYPKDLFVDDPQVLGGDINARQAGVGIATHERETFIEELKAIPVVPAYAEDPLSEQLRAVVAEFRADGYEPTIILLPLSWTVMRTLELERYRPEGDRLDRPAWSAGDERVGSVLGAFEGVPVSQSRRGLEDRIIIVDLSRFATWREWLHDGEPLSFEIKYLNDVEAAQLAEDQPKLFEDEGDLAARTKAIRMSVVVRSGTRYEIEVNDLEAARALEVPEGLRR
jgi:hypothetical protein